MAVKKPTILIADDDPQLLRLMMRILQLEGYAVFQASDGLQAFEHIEQKSPNLVLLDVMMPKLDGFSVCYRVRQFSEVPIILVSARGQDQDRMRGLDLGADDYLARPFSVSELLARVRAVLRHKIEVDPTAPHYILTIVGVGYALASLPPAALKKWLCVSDTHLSPSYLNETSSFTR